MRINFFGDGPWATGSLEQLLTENNDVSSVVIRSNPTENKLKALASRHRIPVFQPEKVNDSGFVQQVACFGADLNLSVSYDQILKEGIRGTSRLGFVNFHAGKLPNYRGRNVINWALINGEEEIGITAHFVDDGIDTGDIILQRTLPILWKDSYGDILAKVVKAFPALVSDTVRLIAGEALETRSQSGMHGTYYAARGPGDEWIDWSDTSRNIYNLIRGIALPGPGARTTLRGDIVIVCSAEYNPEWPKYKGTPGQIVGKEGQLGVIGKNRRLDHSD